MNISCVICQDLFVPSAEIVTVVCGHLFHSTCIYEWIERSKSCPQCRQKISSKTTHRIFFNISKTDDDNLDIATLHNKLDSYSFDIRVKKKELATAQEKNVSLEAANLGLRQLVSEHEGKIRKLESTLLALKDQIKYLKEESNQLEEATKQIEQLQKELDSLQKIKQLMISSKDDVPQVLQGYEDPKGLATMIVFLKKELVEQNYKCEKLRKRVIAAEAELKEKKNELNMMKLRNKKKLNDNNKSLGEQNEQLGKKLQEMEKKNFQDVDDLDQQLNLSMSKMSNSGVVRKYSLKKSTNLKTAESPSLEEKIQAITNSKSPYLKIKSSIIGIDSYRLKSINGKSGVPVSEKCSIFKKKCPINSNLFAPNPNKHTGMGGFPEIEEFPTRKPGRLPIKRPISASSQVKPKARKIIKPDPSLRKMDDFVDLLSE